MSFPNKWALIDLKVARRVQDEIKTSQSTSLTITNGEWATLYLFYATEAVKRFLDILKFQIQSRCFDDLAL